MPELREPPYKRSKLVATEMEATAMPASRHHDNFFEMQVKYRCNVEAANASRMTHAIWWKFTWLPISAKTCDKVTKSVKIWIQVCTKNGIELGVFVLISGTLIARLQPLFTWTRRLMIIHKGDGSAWSQCQIVKLQTAGIMWLQNRRWLRRYALCLWNHR